MSEMKTKFLATVPADDVWGVSTLQSDRTNGKWHCTKPCADCPWRKDAPIGRFPAEAFRLSAKTAYDASDRTFACHMAGSIEPKTCAGFLLSNSVNNLAVRVAMLKGQYNPDDVSSDVPLYESYREMAIANGVPEDDPMIAPCRADWD